MLHALHQPEYKFYDILDVCEVRKMPAKCSQML